MSNTHEEQCESSQLYDEAVDRAKALGVIEHLLVLAHDDAHWRRAVETALSSQKPMSKLLIGGARPADVWTPGLLHSRMIKALNEDTPVFIQFCGLHPQLVGRHNGNSPDKDEIDSMEPFVAVLASFLAFPLDGDFKASQLNRASEVLEGIAGATPVAVVAEESGAAQAYALADDSAADELRARIAELEAHVKERDRTLKDKESDLREAKSELRQRKGEVSRRDQRLTTLKGANENLTAQLGDAQAQMRAMREERDEARRTAKKLQAEVDSSHKGQRKIEMRRADETSSLQQANADLRERLAASQELAAAIEKRLSAVEDELNSERDRRQEVEAVLDSLGFADLAQSSATLQSALNVLQRFTEGASAYLERQQERERERVRLEDIALAEREAAEAARRAEEEAMVAWEVRERGRLQEAEAALFNDGPIDHLIIDGHNLVHRIFRPEREKATRPWLERMAGVMAERLEARGWSTCIHLTFDTPHPSNHLNMGHGVTVYFRNNTTEGGADAQIAELLRDCNPQASYMVVSTDRKHVWTDALEFMREEGTDVDLVQVELLAQYLQALDEVEAR